MAQPAYDGIIFDLDGTLVHSAPDLLAATNHILQKYDLAPVPMQAIEKGISFGALKMMEQALIYAGTPNHFNVSSERDDFINYYHQNIAVHSHVYRGGLDLLSALQQADIPVAVCTNKTAELAASLLDQLGVTPLITALTGGNSFAFKKPDPRHLHETRHLMGLQDGHNLLMVGDSSNDIRAAQNAGWDSAVVTFGYHDMAPSDMGATHQIDSLDQLAQVIWL